MYLILILLIYSFCLSHTLKIKKVEDLFFFKKISQLNVMSICSLNLYMCMYNKSNNLEEYKLFKMNWE